MLCPTSVQLVSSGGISPPVLYLPSSLHLTPPPPSTFHPACLSSPNSSCLPSWLLISPHLGCLARDQLFSTADAKLGAAARAHHTGRECEGGVIPEPGSLRPGARQQTWTTLKDASLSANTSATIAVVSGGDGGSCARVRADPRFCRGRAHMLELLISSRNNKKVRSSSGAIIDARVNPSRFISPKSCCTQNHPHLFTARRQSADPGATPADVRGNSYYPRLPGSRNKWTQLSGGFQASRSRSTSSAARRSANEARTHGDRGAGEISDPGAVCHPASRPLTPPPNHHVLS